jgi:hypothetical protein
VPGKDVSIAGNEEKSGTICPAKDEELTGGSLF